MAEGWPIIPNVFSSSFHPQIRWYQTRDAVIVTVKLVNPTCQSCEFHPDRVVYRWVWGPKHGRFGLGQAGVPNWGKQAEWNRQHWRRKKIQGTIIFLNWKLSNRKVLLWISFKVMVVLWSVSDAFIFWGKNAFFRPMNFFCCYSTSSGHSEKSVCHPIASPACSSSTVWNVELVNIRWCWSQGRGYRCANWLSGSRCGAGGSGRELLIVVCENGAVVCGCVAFFLLA